MIARRKNKPTPTNPFERIDALLADPQLTPSESKIMIAMLIACGKQGRVIYSIRKFAESVVLSESRTRHILCDLVNKGYLIRIERPHTENEWIIPDVFPTPSPVEV